MTSWGPSRVPRRLRLCVLAAAARAAPASGAIIVGAVALALAGAAAERAPVASSAAARASIPAAATPRPSPLIAVVLPHEAAHAEAAFRDVLERRGLRPRLELVPWSGRAEDQPALVARLRRLAPDLIHTWGESATLAVAGPLDGDPHQFVRDRPVVFAEVADPVAARLTSNASSSGRNLTGIRHLPPLAAQADALFGYRAFRQLGLLTLAGDRDAQGLRTGLAGLAGERGVALHDLVLPLDDAGRPQLAVLSALMQTLRQRGTDVLYLDASRWPTLDTLATAVRAAHEAHLATFCTTEAAVRRAGCLFALVSTEISSARFAGHKAWQILAENRRAEELPIEPLKRFSLLINLAAARALDLYPPLVALDGAELLPARR